MTARLISSLLLWSLMLGVCFTLGEPGAVLLIMAGGALTYYECCLLLQRCGIQALVRPGLLMVLALLGGAYYLPYRFDAPYMALLSGVIVLTAALSLLPLYRGDPLLRFAGTLLGLLVIGIPFSLFSLILAEGDEYALVRGLWILVVAKCGDAGAWLTGTLAGRHLLAPTLSPRKTWEGAVGGVILGSLTGAAFVEGLQRFDVVEPHILAFSGWLWMGLPVAAASIAADLLQSALKRRARVKDSGRWIPGIGGVFDLTDSLILAAPAAYAAWYLNLLLSAG